MVFLLHTARVLALEGGQQGQLRPRKMPCRGRQAGHSNPQPTLSVHLLPMAAGSGGRGLEGGALGTHSRNRAEGGVASKTCGTSVCAAWPSPKTCLSWCVCSPGMSELPGRNHPGVYRWGLWGARWHVEGRGLPCFPQCPQPPGGCLKGYPGAEAPHEVCGGESLEVILSLEQTLPDGSTHICWVVGLLL